MTSLPRDPLGVAARLLARWLIAILFVALPAAGQVQPAPAPAPAPAGHAFLWVASSLTNRVYLYGTVHVGKPDFYPLPKVVMDAFDDSGVLAVEADVTDTKAMAEDGGHMVLEPPDTLSNHVPAPLYERYRRQLARLAIGEAQLSQLDPFMASSLLALAEWARLGYLPQYGVDAYLIRRAKASNKQVVELEGVKVQTDIMDSLTGKERMEAFEGTVGALESGLTGEQIRGMVKAWQTGDADLLLQVARTYDENVPGAKALEEKFIWSRQGAMAAKIEQWLLDGRQSVFVAVGALHLAGPRGLVEILRQRGFVVRQS